MGDAVVETARPAVKRVGDDSKRLAGVDVCVVDDEVVDLTDRLRLPAKNHCAASAAISMTHAVARQDSGVVTEAAICNCGRLCRH